MKSYDNECEWNIASLDLTLGVGIVIFFRP